MREIKFRGWHEDAKDMVYFELGANFIDCLGRDDNAHYVFDLEDGHSVMQYTGLKDKNGVEIYEGDVVATRYKGGGKEGQIHTMDSVKWGAKNIGANNYEYDFYVIGPYVDDEYLYGEMIEGKVEVIGNIYENAELLEK